jgi:hypothetical protein
VELIEKGERLSQAEETVRTQKASSSDSTTDGAPLPEKDESLEKVEQQLDRILKILTKKDATIQQDKLIKLSAKAQEICDRLKMIGAKNPNFSCQNTGCTSDDHQTKIKEEPNDANSGNFASEEDDVAELDNDGLESIEDDSHPNGTYRLRINEDLSNWPEGFREDMRQDIKDIKKKNVRAGCELLWNGKTYAFQGYY